MERVVVNRKFVGICHMQVCAVPDATDEEILVVCNRENPAGTENGWCNVYRDTEPNEFWGDRIPVSCEVEDNRTHFLVSC